MKTLLRSSLSGVLVVACCAASGHAQSNVALGASVTLHGSFFVMHSSQWPDGWLADPETIVDGVFLERSQQWNQGPVWWDSNDGEGQYLTIDLGDACEIESLVVQADDNDAYDLYYWDEGASDWSLAWHVPSVGGWGMQTRPNPDDNSERYSLDSPVTTTALKFEGSTDSDLLFSVSEIQAYGHVVPEPSTPVLCLLLSSLAAAATLRRKRNTT